ncbi:hypothetical protein ACFX15_041320 [Malus domestica]
MMEDLWTVFCGESGRSDAAGKPCSSNLESLIRPSSCINHASIIGFDILLLVLLLINMFHQSSSKTVHVPRRFQGLSCFKIVSAIVNGCLGTVYMCLGIWILEERLRNAHTALPLNWCLLTLFHGFAWLFVGLTVSLHGKQLPKQPSRLLSILAFLFSGIVFVPSLSAAIFRNELSLKTFLDVLSFPGATLLLLCVYKGNKYEDGDDRANENGLYRPLNGGIGRRLLRTKTYPSCERKIEQKVVICSSWSN